jgi:benzoate 4-monooxygenase
MFSYDAITNVFWSQTYGFLDRGDDDCWAEAADGSLERVHAMETFHTNVGFSVLMGHLSPFWFNVVKNKLLAWTFGGVSGRRWAGMARHLAAERLRSPPADPDLFSNLPVTATDKHPDPMTPDEIVAESGVMLNAGNDTTQSTLTNVMYELARNPDKQAKLRKMLHDGLKPEEIPIASYESLQHIAYLRAVIAGETIPAGVTVSSQIWGLQRREDLFKDAATWKPERWLSDEDGGDASDEERANLKEFVVPFSLGPRACIGRNLAYMELSICIASLVMAFEWELADRSDEIKYHERFNCNPIALPVRARKIV